MSPAIGIVLCLAAAEAATMPVDFDTQVMPILTKAGCNTGACHGAAAGRGGFHLSLYGSDPAADVQAITQQWEGRRINTVRPDRSLVFRKPTADMNHGGDQRFAYDSESARLLLQWIREGATRVPQRSLVRVEATPSAAVTSSRGEQVALEVQATFEDGATADVTRWAVVTPEDPASLAIKDEATLEVKRPGRHLALVRYLDRVVPVHVTLPYSLNQQAAVADTDHGPIDGFIDDQLELLGLETSPPAHDATFLRRLTLNLTGRLPTPAQVEAFLADDTTTKRNDRIDTLLDSPEFVEYWTFEFSKLLRLRPVGKDAQAPAVFREWVFEQLTTGKPFDAMARSLVTASGDSHQVGPASFHRMVSGPREEAEFVSELFMGVRLRCANCHDHPLDRWTQDDYHGLAAIFARLQRGQVVGVGERGDVSHPRTGEPAVPRLPGEAFLRIDGDVRSDLAAWLTSAENPYFARAMVNRLWKHMLGRGLVEPVDDLRATNPGTHPQLLEWLATDFVAHDFDLRHTLRTIAGSDAYQRQSQPTEQNAIDDRYYSHFFPTPLEPEVLADAVADVTGVPFAYGDETPGTRAVSLIDPQEPAPSLDVLGRCGREESCETTNDGGGGVAVKLHLLNGAFLNDALTNAKSRLQEHVAANADTEQLVEEFYLRSLARRPTQTERAFWIREFAEAGDNRLPVAEDFLWSLLASHEFMTNH